MCRDIFICQVQILGKQYKSSKYNNENGSEFTCI